MTEEEARELREENIKLKEEAIQKDRRIEDLEGRLVSALLRLEELERRLAKDSHNSSKPPSSDGFKRKGKKRPTSSKATGGQAGHAGHMLGMEEKPDQVIIHRPSHCEACSYELGAVGGQVKERRQIQELPVMRLVVTEHQVEVLTCPRCQHQNVGRFPSGVQALAVYLSQYHLLPMERIGEVFEDLLACSLSEGTLANWIQEAARTLAPTMQVLKSLLLAQKVDHVDVQQLRPFQQLRPLWMCA